MFVVSRSTTGQYVVSDPGSNTVVVGDDLVATFDRMVALAAEQSPRAADVPTRSEAGGAMATGKRMLPYLLLALLPFVWLGALHISLGRLVSELRQTTAPAAESETMVQLRARLDRLERQAESRPAPAAGRPRQGPMRPAGATSTDDDDDDPDDEDDEKADAKIDTKADAKADDKADDKADAKADDKADAKADDKAAKPPAKAPAKPPAKPEPIEPDDDGGAD